MSKDYTIKLVVVGGGDTSVGIQPSTEYITIQFHDQTKSFLEDTNMVESLKEFFQETMENCRTRVYTEEEYEDYIASPY